MKTSLSVVAALSLALFALTLMGQASAFYQWRTGCIAVRETVAPSTDQTAKGLQTALFSMLPSSAYWQCVRVVAVAIFASAVFGLYRCARDKVQLGGARAEINTG